MRKREGLFRKGCLGERVVPGQVAGQAAFQQEVTI